MHSELSEALEAIRHVDESGHYPPATKIPGFNNLEEELADCMIRIMDFAAHYDLRVMGAVMAKHEHNLTRPYKHGKAF